MELVGAQGRASADGHERWAGWDREGSRPVSAGTIARNCWAREEVGSGDGVWVGSGFESPQQQACMGLSAQQGQMAFAGVEAGTLGSTHMGPAGSDGSHDAIDRPMRDCNSSAAISMARARANMVTFRTRGCGRGFWGWYRPKTSAACGGFGEGFGVR